MQTLVIIPVGREDLGSFPLGLVNQGGDRDRTAKNLVNRNEQENADITLGTDITLQDNQPKIVLEC